jgi:anhydro-N-acetylmuramic acid kinase
LIDSWVRKNLNEKFDNEGRLASSGKKNEIIFEQAQELYSNRIEKEKTSFDTNDFDISFVRGLSPEDGAATLTDFTACIIGEELTSLLLDFYPKIKEILICGGGRKNKILLKKIKENISLNINLRLIEDYKINGDFVESQAFAFLAIRSILKLPISFPKTTGCLKPCSGGVLINN